MSLENPQDFKLSNEERQSIVQEVLRYLDDTDSDLLKTKNDVSDIETNGVNKAKTLVNDSLETQIDGVSKNILKDFKFGTTDYAGAVKAGNLIWNQSTGALTSGSGVAIYRGGIVGAKNGTATFTIDTSGNAMFAGSLSAATGTFTGTVSAGAIIAANINANLINAGTLTGRTVKANNGSGVDVWLQNTGVLSFRKNNTQLAYIYVNSSGASVYHADANLNIDGYTVFINASNDLTLAGDDIIIGYDDDDDGSDCYWASENAGQNTAKLTTGGDFKIHGNYYTGYGDFAEFFENKTKGIIPYGTSVVMDGGKIREAKKDETPFGVVSSTAGVIGNAGYQDAGESWGGKYEKNEDGTLKTTKVKKYRYKLIEIDRETKKKITKRGIAYYKKDIPKGAKDIEQYTKDELVVSKEFNEKKKYIPREARPKEWSVVGLIGQIKILKGQQINPNWILMEAGKKYNKYLIK